MEEVFPSYAQHTDHCLLPVSRIYEFLLRHNTERTVCTKQSQDWCCSLEFTISSTLTLTSQLLLWCCSAAPLTYADVVKLTFVFALVREHQTVVLILGLEFREPLFNFAEAEVFFEEGVTVQDRERTVSVCQMRDVSQLRELSLCVTVDSVSKKHTHPPITTTWSSIIKCFTASCRQATAPRRSWRKENVNVEV